MPATAPSTYTLKNRNALEFLSGFAGIGSTLDSKEKEKLFKQEMTSSGFHLENDFTQAMAAALRSKGYDVQIVEPAKRSPDDPDDVDYERLPGSSDAIVHIYFGEVGLYSPRTSLHYLPRVNLKGLVFLRQSKTRPYGETLYYGVDAKEGKPSSIMADPRDAYPSFDFVMSNIELVRRSFQTGTTRIAQRFAEQMHTALQ